MGEHSYQLYSLGTPNGVKATIMFEELLEAGYAQAEYDAWMIKIFEGDAVLARASSTSIPIPRSRRWSTAPGLEPFRVFESGAIMVHLAEKYDAFLPKSPAGPRAETLSWLFWQVGHRAIHRRRVRPFLRLCARALQVPDRPLRDGNQAHLRGGRHAAGQDRVWLAGAEYTIADMANYTWLGNLYHGAYNGSDKFLSASPNTRMSAAG